MNTPVKSPPVPPSAESMSARLSDLPQLPQDAGSPEWERYLDIVPHDLLHWLYRDRPCSGRYQGSSSVHRRWLDLRIDVDSRRASSPVTRRVSGDLYRDLRFALPGLPQRPIRAYEGSWIIDEPQVASVGGEYVITGVVRSYAGPASTMTAEIRVPRSRLQAAVATVKLTREASVMTFTCEYTSSEFRELKLELDVCASVAEGFAEPSYDTHSHTNRPSTLPQRTLTIEETYRDAGVAVTIDRTARQVIDDSAPSLSSWSVAELHDAMETYYDNFGASWPRWAMWGIQAGRFSEVGTAGIMFDAPAVNGGAGRSPDRQGFALFRRHSWFEALGGDPAQAATAAARRDYLYTWVHEAGHAFNFLHSWNKSRPDALSWMNYPWKYDSRNGDDSFWAAFEMQFDTEELIHLRHGDRAAVMMGGDDWGGGSSAAHAHAHEEAPLPVLEDGPLELMLRGREVLEPLEDVEIEVRLRNRLDVPVTVDDRLDTHSGTLVFEIRRPGGQVLRFHPVLCSLGAPSLRVLAPTSAAASGEDRVSRAVSLLFGKQGFAFREPGEYAIRATYLGVHDIVATSRPLRIRIRPLEGRAEHDLADRFYTPKVGMLYALGGSASPYLAAGNTLLAELVQTRPGSIAAAQAALVLGSAIAAPFHRIEAGSAVQVKPPNPADAVELTALATGTLKARHSRELNLLYFRAAEQTAGLQVALGRPAEARGTLAALRDDLAGRGVKPAVLGRVDALLK